MTPRILLRSGKDPFTPVKAETTLSQDVINVNTGNLLFQYAVWRSLSIPGSEITTNGTLTERRYTTVTKDLYERANSEFDVFVVPLANAFREDFEPNLKRLTDFIERLTIPVVVVGVGAQTNTSYDTEPLGSIAPSVKKFVSAVLDRSTSIGVRGEFTANYLASLGFGNEHVNIIGCPSIFLHGPNFQITKEIGTITTASALATNYSPKTLNAGEGNWIATMAKQYDNLDVILQDAHDLRLLLWGYSPLNEDKSQIDHFDHPLYQQGRLKMFVDAWPWIDYMKKRDFVFGTRFHGNVSAILAGTPAHILAHDSRTLELAKFHHIPHHVIGDFDSSLTPQNIADVTDYSDFNRAMPELFTNYISFLERNQLSHIWQHGGNDNGFFEKINASTFEPEVTPVINIRELVSRVAWLQNGSHYDGGSHRDRMNYPFNLPERRYGMNNEFNRLRKQHQSELDALSKRIYQLETQGLRGLWRRIRRRLRS